MCLILAGEFDVQRFAQQHPGNAKQSNEYENSFQRGLTIEHVFIAAIQRWSVLEQHHINEHNQDGGGTTGSVRLEVSLCCVSHPFEEHHENHITEQQNQEQNLGHELQNDAADTLEMHEVDDRHAYTEYHVSYTGNNRQLHFVGIQKDNLVVGHLPNGIKTNWVYTIDMIFRIQL